MAYCRHCGKSIDSNALTCPYCGKSQRNSNSSNEDKNIYQTASNTSYGSKRFSLHQHSSNQPVSNQPVNNQPVNNQPVRAPKPPKPVEEIDPNDKYSLLCGILGFFFFPIGFIYFFIAKRTNPKKARSTLAGAIVGFIVIAKLAFSVAGNPAEGIQYIFNVLGLG